MSECRICCLRPTYFSGTISGEIDLDAVAAMDAGVSQAISVDFDLAIHGESSSYTADVL